MRKWRGLNSGSRRYIGVEVTGVIDVVRPIDYEQLFLVYYKAADEDEEGE